MKTNKCDIAGCPDLRARRKWCNKHYRRWMRHGNPSAGNTEQGASSKYFEEKILLRTDKCIEWPFTRDIRGYGVISRKFKVHRLALEKAVGLPPVGKPKAVHKCGNPSCFNVRHLEWGATRIDYNSIMTHKMTNSREYASWAAMKQRCHKPSNEAYEDYGGRGIKVCDRWRYSFENFYKDMGDRPVGMSIDRVDNSGDYTPGNCRWATHSQQMLNRRFGKFYRMGGQTKNIRQWHRIYPTVSYATLGLRLRSGWDIESALTGKNPRWNPSRKPNLRLSQIPNTKHREEKD